MQVVRDEEGYAVWRIMPGEQHLLSVAEVSVLFTKWILWFLQRFCGDTVINFEFLVSSLANQRSSSNLRQSEAIAMVGPPCSQSVFLLHVQQQMSSKSAALCAQWWVVISCSYQ